MIIFQPIGISIPAKTVQKITNMFEDDLIKKQDSATNFDLSDIIDISNHNIIIKIIRNIFEGGQHIRFSEFNNNKDTVITLAEFFGIKIKCAFPYSKTLDEFKSYIRFSKVEYINQDYDSDISADIIDISYCQITGVVDIGKSVKFNAEYSSISGFTGSASNKLDISGCENINGVVDIGKTKTFLASGSGISGFCGIAETKIDISECKDIDGIVNIKTTKVFDGSNSSISGFTGVASKKIDISGCKNIIGTVDIGETEKFYASDSSISGFSGTAYDEIKLSFCENIGMIDIGGVSVFEAIESSITGFIGSASKKIDISGCKQITGPATIRKANEFYVKNSSISGFTRTVLSK